jgi:hypothetical protein
LSGLRLWWHHKPSPGTQHPDKVALLRAGRLHVPSIVGLAVDGVVAVEPEAS